MSKGELCPLCQLLSWATDGTESCELEVTETLRNLPWQSIIAQTSEKDVAETKRSFGDLGETQMLKKNVCKVLRADMPYSIKQRFFRLCLSLEIVF